LPKRTGVMLAKKFEQRLLNKMPDMIMVQAKIDGIRCRAVFKDYGYKLYSSYGNPINSVPHINKALVDIYNQLSVLHINPPTFDGEIYDEFLAFESISSIVSKTTSIDPYHTMVNFHIFDIINEKPQILRTGTLSKFAEILQIPKALKILKAFPCNKEDIYLWLQHFIDCDYEGVIIRDPYGLYMEGKQSCILKLKVYQKESYRICGYYEALTERGKPKGMLGGLHLIDRKGSKFKCGMGKLKHIERIRLWETAERNVMGYYAEVKYLRLTERGIPREPILERII